MNACLQCGQTTTNPKFCSRSCSVTYWNHHQPKRGRAEVPFCEVCGSKCQKPDAICCSRKCSIIRKRKLRNEEIDRNGYFYPHGSCLHTGRHSTVRHYLTSKFGYQCSICGISEWRKQQLSLILDHIDGDAGNWSIKNIRFVCPNCDSQLPTYKSKNKNGTRKYRRANAED